MPILVDYTQIALSGILQFQHDLLKSSEEKKVDLIRHVVLSTLLSNKKKFTETYGDMVICGDGKRYWRKTIFPYYKASRSKARAASDLDWGLIFDTLNGLLVDLRENFPYKVMHIETVEADDIIGVVTGYLQENDLVTRGLMEESQKVLILSSDKDNIQLQKFGNVKQWSPMQKKFVKPESCAVESLIEKICTGDTGDGIPNIMSPDDVFVTDGARQKPFSRKRLLEFYSKGIEACKNDDERRNYKRNEMLVSYDHIPQQIRETIIATYKETPITGNKKTIMGYLMKHRCKNLMEHIEEF